MANTPKVFEPTLATPSSPGQILRAVTAHATNNLPDGVAKSLWVGVQGDIAVVAEGDTVAVVLKGAVGTVPVRTLAVRVTGTTATDIVAIY